MYANRVHGVFPDVPIVIGGIEASLRRFAHYDYWQDRVRQSILADAPADLLVFGMGERQMVEIARRLNAGEPCPVAAGYPGNCVYRGGCRMAQRPAGRGFGDPGFTEVAQDKTAYARAFALHYREQDPVRGKAVAQPHPKTVVIQNPPAPPLTTAGTRSYLRTAVLPRTHPSYQKPVPALEPVSSRLRATGAALGAVRSAPSPTTRAGSSRAGVSNPLSAR